MSAACARSLRPSSVFCPDIQPHKIFSACCKNPQKQPIIYVFGVWRSLVAHLHGVQGVASSNPATPTNKIKGLASQGLGPCSVLGVKTGSAAYNGQGTFRHWCHHAENIFRLSRYCNVRQLLAQHGATNKKTATGAVRCRGWGGYPFRVQNVTPARLLWHLVRHSAALPDRPPSRPALAAWGHP